eukprot:1715051-Alexandrium_andersonii.AAC.1
MRARALLRCTPRFRHRILRLRAGRARLLPRRLPGALPLVRWRTAPGRLPLPWPLPSPPRHP